jgi:hypothetical protein
VDRERDEGEDPGRVAQHRLIHGSLLGGEAAGAQGNSLFPASVSSSPPSSEGAGTFIEKRMRAKLLQDRNSCP